MPSEASGQASCLVSDPWSSLLFQRTAVEPVPATRLHFDFISFLAVAQLLDIDLLPITWQPALDSIGRGATAEIRQALIALHTSFAFKRIRPLSKSEEAQEKALRALTAEISILGLPEIRSHVNISTLEAICWDVLSEDDTVWPVLVFAKAQCGDLDQFMRSSKGENLSVEDRLQLCLSIAHAMRDMHCSHIIHGDIKPSNVLIFEASPGVYVPKVTDFGYSTIAAGSNVVYLPRSRPWNAPEHHHRAFSFSDAAKCEIYSIGLVFLWILFQDRLLKAFPVFQDISEPVGDNFEGQLFHFALESVRTDFELEAHQKSLVLLFNATLSQDPNLRSENVDTVVLLLGRVLNSAFTEDSGPSDQLSPPLHRDFQVQKSLFSLIDSHYLLKRQIVNSLQSLYKDSDCPGCRHNSAFQLALCYTIGFGIQRSDEMASSWLSKSGKDMSSIEAAKEAALNSSWLWKNPRLRQLDQQGHIRMVDYVADYQKTKDIERARLECEREIRDTTEGFGKKNIMTKNLKIHLAEILEGQGNFGEAEIVLSSLSEEDETGPGLGDDDNGFLDVQHRLAISLYHQGKHQQAVDVLEKEILKKERIHHPEHRSALSARATLGTVLAAQGKYDDSEKLRRSALAGYESLLGPDHPEVLTMLNNLADTMSDQGRYAEAEEMQTRVFKGNEGTLGADHKVTLTSLSNLAESLRHQGKYEAAEELNRKALKGREKLLGNDDLDTLQSVGNLASTLSDLGRHEEAEGLHQRALDGRIAKLGSDHPQTLISMAGLAGVLEDQGRFDEAEPALREVLELSEKSIGRNHPITFGRASNLAAVLGNQGKHEAAEEINRLAMEGCINLLGENHPTTLTITSNLGLNLQNLGQHEAASEIFRKSLESGRRTLGNTHPITLAAMSNLANLMTIQGDLQGAEDMNQQVLQATETAWGKDHISTLTSVQNLAAVMHAQGRYVLAVPYYMRACAGLRNALGPAHPQTLACFRNYFDMIALMSEEEIEATT